MNFRSRTVSQHPGIQLAPLVDVLMLSVDFLFADVERRAQRKRARCQSPKSVGGEGENGATGRCGGECEDGWERDCESPNDDGVGVGQAIARPG